MAEIQAVAGLEKDLFYDLYWKYRDDYDAGRLSGPAYWQEIGQAAGREITVPQAERLIEVDCRSWSHTNRKTLKWARNLKAAGYCIGILSNMHTDLREYLKRNAPWLPAFSHCIFSCDVGMVKPEPGIYKLLLEDLPVPAAQTVFLDDKQPNLDAAAKLGIQGILVRHGIEDAIGEAAVRFGLPQVSPQMVIAP